MVKRFQINKRKTNGYNVVEFKPKFGGQKIKFFKLKKNAKKYVLNRKRRK